MRFKIGDVVMLVLWKDAPNLLGFKYIGKVGTIKTLNKNHKRKKYATVSFLDMDAINVWKEELELVKSVKDIKANKSTEGKPIGIPSFLTDKSLIRTFDTGATRDTAEGKLDYIKALSPEVLECYVAYIGKHRKQPDGNMRDWDNWKKGISKEVYLSSLFRHTHAAWMLLLGHKVNDNHGEVNLKDALCGIIFNAQGILYEELKNAKSKTNG
jgi:hypothetical protein